MKKVAAILVVVLLLFSLSGCEYSFNYEELIQNVQTIEIIDYSPITEEETLLTVISESDKSLLLMDLCQLKYQLFYGPPEKPYGQCVKLTYVDGNIEIIGWRATTERSTISCDKVLFEEMLSKYCPN